MKKSIRGTVFILMALAPAALFGQQTLKKLGQWGSASFRDIVVNGNYAYCAAGFAGLEILDIGDRTHPVRVAGIETSSPANSICFNKGFIYVSVNPYYDYYSGSSFLEIIDVRDPLNPIKRGKKAVGMGLGSIVVQGNYLYLNTTKGYESGLAIFNVSNPDLPVQVGFISGYFREFCVRNNYVFAVHKKGLAVINVSNPSVPFWVSVTVFGRGDIYGHIQLKGNHIFLVGDFYLDYGSETLYEKNWFGIVDISDPAAPRLVWERSVVDRNEKDVLIGTLCIFGNYVFIGSGRLDVMDISNIANPVKINSMNISNNTIYEMICDNQYLYTATIKGLVIYSIASPRDPIVKGVYDECGVAGRVWAFDRNVCLAQDVFDSGLRIIDASDPAAPKLEWSYFEDGFPVYWGMIYERYGYLLSWRWSSFPWKIIDVSDPLHPVSVWSYPLKSDWGGISQLVIKERFAYVTIHWGKLGRLEIYDITDPTQPLLLASDTTIGETIDSGALAVNGDYVYCYTFNNKTRTGLFHVFKFSNGQKLIHIGSIQLSYYRIRDIAIRYPYAYGLGYDNEAEMEKLQIFDVSDPAQPSLLGNYQFLSSHGYSIPESIYFRGHYAYVAGGASGLLAIDVNDPTHPKEVASFKTPSMCDWVHGFGNRIYATDEHAGRMYILEALDSGSILVDLSVKRKAERAWTLHPYADIWINIWNEDNIPISSYLISREEDKGTYVVVKEVSSAEIVANKYNYRDFGLVNKKKYTYKVEALDAQGKVIAVSEEVTI